MGISHSIPHNFYQMLTSYLNSFIAFYEEDMGVPWMDDVLIYCVERDE